MAAQAELSVDCMEFIDTLTTSHKFADDRLKVIPGPVRKALKKFEEEENVEAFKELIFKVHDNRNYDGTGYLFGFDHKRETIIDWGMGHNKNRIVPAYLQMTDHKKSGEVIFNLVSKVGTKESEDALVVIQGWITEYKSYHRNLHEIINYGFENLDKKKFYDAAKKDLADADFSGTNSQKTYVPLYRNGNRLKDRQRQDKMHEIVLPRESTLRYDSKQVNEVVNDTFSFGFWRRLTADNRIYKRMFEQAMMRHRFEAVIDSIEVLAKKHRTKGMQEDTTNLEALAKELRELLNEGEYIPPSALVAKAQRTIMLDEYVAMLSPKFFNQAKLDFVKYVAPPTFMNRVFTHPLVKNYVALITGSFGALWLSVEVGEVLAGILASIFESSVGDYALTYSSHHFYLYYLYIGAYFNYLPISENARTCGKKIGTIASIESCTAALINEKTKHLAAIQRLGWRENYDMFQDKEYDYISTAISEMVLDVMEEHNGIERNLNARKQFKETVESKMDESFFNVVNNEYNLDATQKVAVEQFFIHSIILENEEASAHYLRAITSLVDEELTLALVAYMNRRSDILGYFSKNPVFPKPADTPTIKVYMEYIDSVL